MSVQQLQKFYFRLALGREQFLRHYQGRANAVQVRTECDRLVRFPAGRLRPFLTHNGIHGRFCLTVDADNRFVDLKPAD